MKHDEVKRNTYYKLSNHFAEYTLLRESGYQKVYHGARLGAFLSKTLRALVFLDTVHPSVHRHRLGLETLSCPSASESGHQACAAARVWVALVAKNEVEAQTSERCGDLEMLRTAYVTPGRSRVTCH